MKNPSVSKIVANALTRIPAGTPRMLFVYATIIVLLVVVTRVPQLFGIPIVLGMLAYFINKLIRRIIVLFPLVWQHLVRKLWRMVIATRQFYKIPDEVEFFHAVTIIVALMSLIYLLATKDANGYGILNYSIAIFLGAAALFDASSRISWLVKKTWAKAIGKLFFAGVGTALVFVAAAIAKQFVREVTHADPQHFQEFVSLLTSIFTPLLFGFALCAAVFTFAILEFVGMSLALGLAVPVLSLIIQSIVGKPRSERFFYRIRTGKQPPDDYKPEPFEWKGMICFMRPMALVLAIYVVISSMSALTSLASPSAKDWGSHLLVWMHYHTNTDCGNLNRNALIADLDGGNSVSVVSFGTEISFTNKVCKRSALPEF